MEVANELSAKLTLVVSNPFGQIVAKKILLSTFCRSKEDWKKILSETDNKRKLFSNLWLIDDNVKYKNEQNN